MIWDRERYIAHCSYEFTGCEMFSEMLGKLVGLENEWRLQGATESEIDLSAFGFDYVLRQRLAGDCFARSDIEERIVLDDETQTIFIDKLGRKTRLCKESASIPLPLTHPVKTMDDWQKIKNWYEFSNDRIDIETLKKQRELRDKGHLMCLHIPGAFDEPRELMGEEAICIACYEEPELLHDMLSKMSDTCVNVIEKISQTVPIDNLVIHEDMAGKSGPLFGPTQVKELMKPYYNKVWEAAKNAGAKIFSQDSDGDMNPILDDLIECGLTMILPCEPGSGMDIVKLRQKYDKKLAYKGGIDKYVLMQDKNAILKELEYKMLPLLKQGGVIFGLDHRIPNGVNIENYRFYVNTAREILGLPKAETSVFNPMLF